MNPEEATIYSDLLFSGKRRYLSGSRTLFRRSNTESSARFISSIKKTLPYYILSTRGPSCHSKRVS